MRYIPINQSGSSASAMAEPTVQDFIIRTNNEIMTFPPKIVPFILSSLVLSAAVNMTDDPKAALQVLTKHILNSVDEAIAARNAALD